MIRCQIGLIVEVELKKMAKKRIIHNKDKKNYIKPKKDRSTNLSMGESNLIEIYIKPEVNLYLNGILYVGRGYYSNGEYFALDRINKSEMVRLISKNKSIPNIKENRRVLSQKEKANLINTTTFGVDDTKKRRIEKIIRGKRPNLQTNKRNLGGK